MINIDNLLLRTQNRILINRIHQRIHTGFVKKSREKGWARSYETYTNGSGITLFFNSNTMGEVHTLFVRFSAHKQINEGIHNADCRTLAQAQRAIVNVFAKLGVTRGELGEFSVSSIEIGVNFKVMHNPYKILEAALMFDKHFYQYHDKFRHYKFAAHPRENYKYQKAKLYIKSYQIDSITGLTYQQLGFCDHNIMRIEFKLERASKFKFINFSSVESLFKRDAMKQIEKFFMEQFAKLFFYSPADIITKGLKKIQWKHYYQWQVSGFWDKLPARKLKNEKNFYDLLPKKYDLKNEIGILLGEEIDRQKIANSPTFTNGKKMSIFLPYEKVRFRTPFLSHSISSATLCRTCQYVGIGIQTITSN